MTPKEMMHARKAMMEAPQPRSDEQYLDAALCLLKKAKLIISEFAAHTSGNERKQEMRWMVQDLDEMYCELQELFVDEEIEPDDFTYNDD